MKYRYYLRTFAVLIHELYVAHSCPKYPSHMYVDGLAAATVGVEALGHPDWLSELQTEDCIRRKTTYLARYNIYIRTPLPGFGKDEQPPPMFGLSLFYAAAEHSMATQQRCRRKIT